MQRLDANYDLIVVANVFHHIVPTSRQATIETLRERLGSAGRLIIFEHNPLNPLTRLSVRLSPIDKNAQLVSAKPMMTMMRRAGFSEIDRRFIVFFPKMLSWLQPLEPRLSWLPLGAQYVLISKK
jgi:hypothetical protein